MTREFSTESYLTNTYETSSTRLRIKCKRIGICCFGLCLLVGSWGIFFVSGYHYNQSFFQKNLRSHNPYSRKEYDEKYDVERLGRVVAKQGKL